MRDPLSALRAARLRRRAGVELARGTQVGRRVVVDLADGATLRIGDGARIGDGTRLVARAAPIEIGPGASLGERCAIVAQAGVRIGERAALDGMVAIIDFDHRFDDCEQPIRLQGTVGEPVTVEERAVLGHGVAVQRGARVGAGAEVLANSVVRGRVAPGSCVVGVPARPRGSAR